MLLGDRSLCDLVGVMPSAFCGVLVFVVAWLELLIGEAKVRSWAILKLVSTDHGMKVSTSFVLPDELWKKIKVAAIERGTTVSAVVAEALSSAVSRGSGSGVFIPEGAPKHAFMLKVLTSESKQQLMTLLITEFMEMGIGDMDLLGKYLKGAKDGWKHPSRTGKESEALAYLFKLCSELHYPGFD